MPDIEVEDARSNRIINIKPSIDKLKFFVFVSFAIVCANSICTQERCCTLPTCTSSYCSAYN